MYFINVAAIIIVMMTAGGAGSGLEETGKIFLGGEMILPKIKRWKLILLGAFIFMAGIGAGWYVHDRVHYIAPI
ncbi:MAG: hypothetical protein PHQ27_10890 [Victivallales bacterium]|nr:hypothetical protein [Victivallales bacterium]